MARGSAATGDRWSRSGSQSLSSLCWRSSAAASISPLAISRPRRPRSKRCCPMPASRNEAPPVSRRLEAFLEMLAAERGAARLTLQAYRNDLADLAQFLAARGESLEDAAAALLHAYLAAATTRELAPRTLARRLSAMRQFYR